MSDFGGRPNATWRDVAEAVLSGDVPPDESG